MPGSTAKLKLYQDATPLFTRFPSARIAGSTFLRPAVSTSAPGRYGCWHRKP